MIYLIVASEKSLRRSSTNQLISFHFHHRLIKHYLFWLIMKTISEKLHWNTLDSLDSLINQIILSPTNHSQQHKQISWWNSCMLIIDERTYSFVAFFFFSLATTSLIFSHFLGYVLLVRNVVLHSRKIWKGMKICIKNLYHIA